MAGTKLHVALWTLNCMNKSNVYPHFFKHCMVPNTKINANAQNSKLCPHTLLFPLFTTRPNCLTKTMPSNQGQGTAITRCACAARYYELDMINK